MGKKRDTKNVEDVEDDTNDAVTAAATGPKPETKAKKGNYCVLRYRCENTFVKH